MSSSSAYKNIIRIVVGSLIGVYITIIALLNIPYIQKRLSCYISSELSDKFQTEVKIGNIDIGLLNRIIIHDLNIMDRSGNNLLAVSDMSAKFNISSIINGKLVISSVQIFDFYLNINKQSPAADTNLQFIIDALSDNKKDKDNSSLDLRINSLLIRNGNLKYDVFSIPETPRKFNTSHIDLNNISGIISIKSLNNDSLNARIRGLSFTEKSGINLKKFSSRVIGSNNKLVVSNIDIMLSLSTLRLHNIVFRYKSLKNLLAFKDDISYSGNVNAVIVPSNFAPFLPVLDDYDDIFNLNVRLSGNNNEIKCSRFSMTSHSGMEINGEAYVKNLKEKKDTEFSVSLFKSNLSNRDISKINNCFNLKLPSPVTDRKFANFRGEMSGTIGNVSLDGQLQSDLGNIRTKVIMNTDTNGSRSYSGKMECKKLSLASLLDSKDYGDADFNIIIKGFNYKNKYPESYIKGVVNSVEYKNYKYQNILLDGTFKDKGFNGKLTMNDKNADINVDGNISLSGKEPAVNILAKVRNFSPNKLNLSDKYKQSRISFNLNADFIGKSVDALNGTVILDSLYLDAPDDGSYFLDRMTLTASHDGDRKNMQIESPFMNGKVTGRYKYETIASSIINNVRQYLPSLVGKQNTKDADNDIAFDINVSNGDFFSKMLFLPIELAKPMHLKGEINDMARRMRLEASMPRFKYKNTTYDSGIMTCQSNGEALLCSLYGGMLLNSGIMLNLSLKADAKDDLLSSTLNWGNNSVNTYGGRFSAVTKFSRSANTQKTDADIQIQKSKVILNDSVWNVHPSSVFVTNGDVIIDNFIFEHRDQHIKINGELTRENDDSCDIDMKNIDLKYLLDIVQFDDVEFGGMITGNVILKNLMKNAGMYASLNVKDFSVNDAILGNGQVNGMLNRQKDEIDINALFKDKEKSTNVTGYVSPKRKELDLHIKAAGTNIALLTPYVDGIFSNLGGGVHGNIRLFGDFKHLDFEGDARASLQAKVDVLNTTFRVVNDSVHIRPGSFIFNKVKIEDADGNRGVVTGYLNHTKLKHLMYHFSIDGNNLLMYNTQQNNSYPFYGKVYASGNVMIDGGNNAMNVDAKIRTSPNTTFTYLTSMPGEATNNQFITFVDKTPKRIQDNITTNLYHPLNKVEDKKDDGPAMDLRINMMIEATPDASMKIIMDPIAGDNIMATGRGNLHVNYYNKGDFRIFGNYNINKGMYKLSMQEIIRKDFTLKQGGTVTFTGDPYQANLNLQAVYTVSSASLSDLGVGAVSSQGGQSSIKVNCLMNLTGSISDPTIKFDLELPTLNEEDKELVRSATSTEEQMNTQIIYLLGIGKFYTYDYANTNSTQSSNATSSLAFSTLSGQLNNMLSQWVDNKNWNIGANLSTGEKGWTDVEAEAILSGSLLNNRLLINGNFGYKDNAMANTNFIGDFEAIWLLTKNGDWRLRGYNQTNDRYYLKPTLTTQGIGIMYKKDFNKWNELFKWALWWKKPSNDKK